MSELLCAGRDERPQRSSTVDSHASLLFLPSLPVSLSLSAALFEQVGQSKWCVGGEALSRIDGCVNRQQSHIDCEDFGTGECKRRGEHRWKPFFFSSEFVCVSLFKYVFFFVCKKNVAAVNRYQPTFPATRQKPSVIFYKILKTWEVCENNKVPFPNIFLLIF